MSKAKDKALATASRQRHMEICYLIDQQASEQMCVFSDTTKYQGIEIETFTPMVEHREIPLKLSKAQALELIPALQEAAERMPDPPERCEYPGCLL